MERRYSFIRPLDGSGYVEQVQKSDRFMLGILGLDAKTRGLGRGELTLITGRTTSGKTQLVMNALNNNSDKHIIVFTPDESPELVLAKLISIRYGVSAEQLEQSVRSADADAIKLVMGTAQEDFKRLIVIDRALSTIQMGHALDEAEDYWGHKCDATVYDYLELLAADNSASAVTRAAHAIKMWGKQADVTNIVIHQGKRGEGLKGESAGLEGMRYGGEAESTFVIEVYRQRDNPKLGDMERSWHEDTVTARVLKNKRPGGKLGAIDLYLNPNTGHIRTLTAEDRFRAGEPTRDAAVMLRARKDTDQ